MRWSKTYVATPPGETIREQLQDREMTQEEFAARMALSEKQVGKLLDGEVQLTPEISIRLEDVLGVPATFWNNLEAIYRDKLAKVQAENGTEKNIVIVKSFSHGKMGKTASINGTSKTLNTIILPVENEVVYTGTEVLMILSDILGKEITG